MKKYLLDNFLVMPKHPDPGLELATPNHMTLGFRSDGMLWKCDEFGNQTCIERDEFTDLIDTPSTYAGASTKFVRVNSAENALYFSHLTPQDTVLIQLAGYEWLPESVPSSDPWSAITYGNGMFLSMAYSGAVMTSVDGINWVYATNTGGQPWTNVIYANGLYVAIAFSGHCATSVDGSNWDIVQIYNPSGTQFTDIAYGNGIFVAIVWDGTVCISADCTNWAMQYGLLTNYNWCSIIYDGTKFIAVANSGHSAYSVDGTNWSTPVQICSTIEDVAYGNGIYITIGGGTTITRSTDGISWSDVPISWSSGTHRIAYGGGMFAAIAQGSAPGSAPGNHIRISSDGLNWIAVGEPNPWSWVNIAYSDDLKMFASVATGGSNNQLVMISSEASFPLVDYISYVTPNGNLKYVRNGVLLTVKQDYQHLLYGNFTVDGTVNNSGDITVINGVMDVIGQVNLLGAGSAQVLELKIGA